MECASPLRGRLFLLYHFGRGAREPTAFVRAMQSVDFLGSKEIATGVASGITGGYLPVEQRQKRTSSGACVSKKLFLTRRSRRRTQRRCAPPWRSLCVAPRMCQSWRTTQESIVREFIGVSVAIKARGLQ